MAPYVSHVTMYEAHPTVEPEQTKTDTFVMFQRNPAVAGIWKPEEEA